MEIVKGETWRDKREEILGEERATLLATEWAENDRWARCGRY
jgi:hypothetical protein